MKINLFGATAIEGKRVPGGVHDTQSIKAVDDSTLKITDEHAQKLIDAGLAEAVEGIRKGGNLKDLPNAVSR